MSKAGSYIWTRLFYILTLNTAWNWTWDLLNGWFSYRLSIALTSLSNAGPVASAILRFNTTTAEILTRSGSRSMCCLGPNDSCNNTLTHVITRVLRASTADHKGVEQRKLMEHTRCRMEAGYQCTSRHNDLKLSNPTRKLGVYPIGYRHYACYSQPHTPLFEFWPSNLPDN